MRTLFLAAALAGAAPAGAQQLPYDLADSPAPAAEPAGAAGPKLHYGLLDRFEWVPQHGEDGFAWDFSALYGGETNRLWVNVIGEGGTSPRLDYLEMQALYSRAVTPFLDLQAGLRYDARPRPDRLYFTAGGQYERGSLWLGAFGFLSDEGELSGRLVGVYNLALVGPLVLQPSFALDAYGEDIPALGIGRGFTYAEAGLRLRYTIKDAFAPYVGFSWERVLGRTARIAREAGEDVGGTNLVLGVRSEF